MKILFDSNILALTFLENFAMHRTGIFRYADNLLKHLSQYQNVEVTLFSTLEKDDENRWRKKMSDLSYLKNVDLFNSRHPLLKQMDRIREKMAKNKGLKHNFYKGYLESLRILKNGAMRTPFGKMSAAQINEFDVFFSPYHPIPKEVQANPNILCFTAVHDLIPLKYPKYFEINKRPFFDKIFKEAKSNHFFLALSNSTKADICHYYSIDPDKIFIVSSAPQEELFYPENDIEKIQKVKDKYGIEGEYILSVATIEPRKNIPFLIDAYKLLLKECPNITHKLVLTGEKGWGVHDIESKLYGYEDRIILTGYIDDQDLASIYSAASVFAYPSLCEGFGLPPLEAMSCQTPVIVSDRSSLPEVVGDAGLYVDPSNIVDLKNQLKKLLSDKELALKLKEKSQKQVKKFTWKKNASKALDAFELGLKQVG